MKWVIRIVGGVVVLVVAFAVLAPMLISTEGMVTRAEAEATKVLGRDVSIGKIDRLSLLPPKLTSSDLTVANAEGFDAPHLVNVGQASLGVKFFPLLSGQVAIDTFVLDQPSIFLEARADGSNNFTLGEESEAATTDEGAAPVAGGKALVVGNIVINDGSLTYSDGTESYAATDVDVTLTLPPLGKPLVLDASMALEGLPTTAKIRVQDPWLVTSSNAVAADMTVELAGNRIKGAVDAVVEPLKLSGPVDIDFINIAALEPLIGAEAAEAAAPLGPVIIDGTAELTSDQAGFRGATFKTDIAEGTGDFVLATSGPRPKLTGKLAAALVDLRPLMPEAAEAEPAEGASFPPWSDDAIDVEGLRAADADLMVTADLVKLPTYDMTDIAAKATANAGRINLSLQSAKTLGGNATGNVALDARSNTPTLASEFTFDRVDFAQAGPALLGTDRVTGQGTIGFNITTKGASQKDWVSGLLGTAYADVTEGAILGIDMNAIANSGLNLVSGLQDGSGLTSSLGASFTTLTTEAAAEGAKTDFDLADMDITIANGVVDLGTGLLTSDTFRATLSGKTNLPEQSMNIAVRLSAKAPEAETFRELKAPVVVTGTFNEPKIKVDTAPLLRSAAEDKAADALRRSGIDVEEGQSVGDALRERAGSELRNLFGRRSKDDDEEEEEPPQD
ncbi:MAG: AsmA family protein [Pseudomonadota bacterium]